MTKKLLVLTLAALLIASIIAPVAMAAITDQQQKTIDEIHQKMAEYHNQLVDVYREAGLITKEQADYMKEQTKLRAQYKTQAGYGMGIGRGGYGMGRGMGFGGPCMQYYAPAPAN